MSLSRAALEKAAKDLGCELAVIQAVAEVESTGDGFITLKGKEVPRVLFEAHIFSRLTNHGFDKSNPDISSFRWNQKLYATGPNAQVRAEREHARLDKAAKLQRNAALQSASWGMFQIMGFNWQDLGYKSLQAFINAMYKSEDEHLDAFVRFVKFKKIDNHLRNKNWDAFAAKYNGPSYKKNRYDDKMEEAYERYKG